MEYRSFCVMIVQLVTANQEFRLEFHKKWKFVEKF